MTRLSENALSQLPWLWQAFGKSWRSYALVLCLVGVTVIALLLFGPHFREPYLFLIPSTLIAGIVGGWGAGLMATSLGLALHLYFTAEYSTVTNPKSASFAIDLARAIAFAAVGIAIILSQSWIQCPTR
jgi:hypothetical protein